MKKHLTLKLFLMVLFVSFCFITVPNIAGAQKAVELNYSTFFPPTHANAKLADAWCKEVEKRTNGKVKITFFAGSTLGKATTMFDDVIKGITDIGYSCFAYSTGRFPLTEVIDLPLGYKNGTTATRMANAFIKQFNPKELEPVKVLYVHAHGPGILHTKKPVKTIDDLKGMKIRATGLASKIVTYLGAAPVGTSMGETYEALRTGVAEGAMAPIEALKGWKWGEMVKATTQNFGSAYTTAMYIVMNKAKWNALPPDVQKVFEEVSAEWIEKQGALWDEIDKDGMEFSKARGNQIIPLSAAEDAKWAAKVKPLLDDYVKNAKAKNLPGDKALKFCQDYLKKAEKPAAPEKKPAKKPAAKPKKS